MPPPPGARRKYEVWHQKRGLEPEADTLWHRMVKHHLSGLCLEGRNLLEIGCGRGDFACWLANREVRPANIVAADFAGSAVGMGRDFSKHRKLAGIHWIVADIEAIPFRTAAFDLVVSCETVEHVPHPIQAISQLARVLKPGGWLFLTTPNYLGPIGLYRAYCRLRGRRFTETGQPINNLVFLPRTMAWIRKSGLRILAVDGIGHFLPIPGRPPLAIPALNSLRPLTRWFALHSCVVAEKPCEANLKE